VFQFAAIAVAIPLVGAAAIVLAAFVPAHRLARLRLPTGTRLYRHIGLIAAAMTFAVTLGSTIVDLVLGPRGPEPFGGLFALVTSAAWLPVIYVGNERDRKRPAILYGLLLILEAAFIGLFSADDSLLFAFSLEGSTLLLYLLISGWGGPEAESAARKFLVYNLTADLVVLIAILGLVVARARMSTEATTGLKYDLSYSLSTLTQDVPRWGTDEIAAQEYWRHARRWLLAALVLGLVIKTPLVPFHTWFSGAVSEGPLCAGLALLGAGSRVSTYAFIRVAEPLWGDLGTMGDLLVAVAVLGAVYQSLLALAHGDLRKLTAHANLAMTSIAIAGLFAQQLPAMIGGILMVLGGGLASTLLFFGFGLLEIRFGVRDLSTLQGLWRRMPQISSAVLLAVLSLAGIPALIGFTGLYPVLGGLFVFEWLGALLAMTAGLIVAWALFWMLERVVFSRPDAEATPDAGVTDLPLDAGRSGDLRSAELWLIAPLVAGIILVGLRPQVIVDLIDASTRIASFTP
jgi:NADH-quinone oxidoreductase subunit M